MYDQYQDTRPWVIYCIRDLTLDDFYIGQTNYWIRRATEHHLQLPAWKIKFPKAKYGTNEFMEVAFQEHHDLEYTWLEVVNGKSEANRCEVYWIQTFKNAGLKLKNKTCGGSFDKQWDVKSVDISGYPKRYMLNLNEVQQMLQDVHAADLIIGKPVEHPNIVQETLLKQKRR